MSKMLCLGMSLNEVNAAVALRRMEYGSLKVGSLGDATVIAVKDGKFDYVDVLGEHMMGNKRIFSEGVVLRGKWWHPK